MLEMYALIPILAIVGGFVVAGLSIYHRTKLRELAYRERIAMIERGLVPPPEANPAAFDELWHGGVVPTAGDEGSRGARCLTAGIILIGIGLMLMVIISYAGNAPDQGVGVGGGIAILGGTFLVCGFVLLRLDRGRPRRTGAAGPAASGQPPLPPSAPNASGGPNVQ